MKSVFITILALFAFSFCWSQTREFKEIIKTKETYVHSETMTQFPMTLEGFERKKIVSYDYQDTHIEVTYKRKNSKEKTTFTVSVYPAGPGTEDRLRVNFSRAMLSLLNINYQVGFRHYPVRFEEGDFKINGFAAEKLNSKKMVRIGLYECGAWFFKYQLTSNNLNSSETTDLIANIEEWFPPSTIAASGLLDTIADINYGRAAFVDSTMLYVIIGEALTKLDWAFENTDSLERRTGFPGMYLELYTTAIKARVDLWKKCDFSRIPSTDESMAQYEKLVNSGFLEEFIMDQFSMFLIVPEGMEFDMDGYAAWKKKNPLDIDLNRYYYLISFPE